MTARWSIRHSGRLLDSTTSPEPWKDLARDVSVWLDSRSIPEGHPFLLSPEFYYDVRLNRYFVSSTRLLEPSTTTINRARALKGFLDFLWFAREKRDWRNADAFDHAAYLQWRRVALEGPHVSGATWNQEVSLLHGFFSWSVAQGLVGTNPIPERPIRSAPGGVWPRRAKSGVAPASFAHDASRGHLEWLPPNDYRRWRDTGVGGYGLDGTVDPDFRGLWVSRNSLFTDLMVRTGLRLSEQAHLLLRDMPQSPAGVGYTRFWLPRAIAKGGSARWVYVPDHLFRDLWDYVKYDRATLVSRARRAGRYASVARPLLVESHLGRGVLLINDSGRKYEASLSGLSHVDRKRLFRETPAGLEPESLWLNRFGDPMSTAGWKSVFTAGNERCARLGVALHCHAHMLRHSFAVVTLEQLQRGHIAALGAQNEAQRAHYTRIFGDPLDWIRRRLGHRSVTTTVRYLHALQELEMESRMSLVPDTWDDPLPDDSSLLPADPAERDRNGRPE